MKKLVFLFLLLLFLLSSCYSVQEVNDMKDSWDEKYNSLEEHCAELESENEDLRYYINHIYEDVATVWCYFEKEEDVTEQEAHDAILRINDLLQSIY